MTEGVINFQPSGFNLSMAQCDAAGHCTFDWPLIEKTAADPNSVNRAIATILLAAREAGRQAVAPRGFE